MGRTPAVAGRFYTSDPEALRKEVEQYCSYVGEKTKYTGCVVPHAGYMFSGATAGKVLSQIDIPDSAVILSPNHTGMGEEFSVWDGGEWETPLGNAAIDKELTDSILALENTAPDTDAHVMEHSIEVVLPFLKVLNPEARIVPITIRCRVREQVIEFGKSLAILLESLGGDTLMIASSDMTHMEPAEQAEKKDRRCIERMEQMDPEGLFDLVIGERISMCGVFPVTAMLSACRELGVPQGQLVEYTNSGQASGDLSSVVGYAGMVF
jgi:AmmeMemoRadiSam system protein B